MSEWRNWCFDPPIKYDVQKVEAYRPDGLAGWAFPKTVNLADLPPWMNVAGLYWRPVPTPRA